MKNAALLIVFSLALNLPLNDLVAQEPAEKHPLLESTFSVGLGAFVFDKEIQLKVNGQDTGDDIDFDERWDVLSDENSFSGVFRWRFGENA